MSGHTKGKIVSEFNSYGGYDCMSGAYRLKIGEQRVAVLDVADYSNISDPHGEHPEAAANAARLALCWNEHDALCDLVNEALRRLGNWHDAHDLMPDGDAEFVVKARALLSRGAEKKE